MQRGIEAAGRVHRDFDLPVVYLTASEDMDTVKRAGQSHAFGYIKKPFDREPDPRQSGQVPRGTRR